MVYFLVLMRARVAVLTISYRYLIAFGQTSVQMLLQSLCPNKMILREFPRAAEASVFFFYLYLLQKIKMFAEF